eukprot:2704786-Amphidinium_carterae.1
MNLDAVKFDLAAACEEGASSLSGPECQHCPTGKYSDGVRVCEPLPGGDANGLMKINVSGKPAPKRTYEGYTLSHCAHCWGA